jgi:hypothetical protein
MLWRRFLYFSLKLLFETVALEFALFLPVLTSTKWIARLTTVIAANLLTHPVVFFVMPCLIPNYLQSLAASEAFAPRSKSFL